MAVPTYCGKCFRKIGNADNVQGSFVMLKEHTASCPANAAEGHRNMPTTVVQELDSLFPRWSQIRARF